MICSKYGIQTHSKGNRTIKQILVKLPKTRISWIRKMVLCIGNSAEKLYANEEIHRGDLQDLGKKIQGAPEGTLTPSMHTAPRAGHSTTQDNFNIIGREDYCLARKNKESIYIRVKNPTITRFVGKYNLHHIWHRVLFNTPDLKM